ncbi:MAG: ABC transporter substrate-binding protein [Caulobacteraceae bacterium]|nr:ABC transporter substrate-binding protein [Caulobacteraceae bacterium]
MMGLRNNDGSPLHPAVPDLADQALRGRIDRRSFLRTVAWLGVNVASAEALLGVSACAPEPAASTKNRIRFVCAVQQMSDPALTTWIEASNLFRNSLEFLTEVDADNITRPYLAESWKPSDDLKTWTFRLRQGVKWSNGDAFTADDVAFNIKRWIDPKSQSVNRTTFSVIQAFEKIDDHGFVLHLSRPVCSLPEQLYAFTCPILHRRFEAEGGDWPKNPVGTGPFELVEYDVSRSARFRRRPGYWGEPAAVEEIDYIDLGTDVATHVAALAAGQVDILYRVTIAELDLVKRLPNARLLSGQAAHTLVMRMQPDQKPFDDKRVRQAVVAAADPAQMLKFAYRGLGVVGENHHVAPFQPDYAPLPRQTRDVAKARRLLAQAGHPNGIDLTLTLGNTQGRWEQDTAQILQQNCAEAGIRIKLNVIPAAEYWSIWDKTPFGLTYWSHRPLGVMVLDLAYRAGGGWNESHFSNPAFDHALDEAMAILDPHARAAAMARAEAILQDEAIMVQPYWPQKFTAVSDRVRGHRVHPSDFFRMDRVGIV